jgi:hypothetical protein
VGVFEQFPYSNFHDLNLDWLLQVIQKPVEEIAAFKSAIEEKINEQDTKIADYVVKWEQLTAEYKTILDTELAKEKSVFDDFYKRTLDVYNKTVLQVITMEGYVDTALANLGSTAQWSISDSGNLTATVFNNGVLISVGMTEDGRMEVITNE